MYRLCISYTMLILQIQKILSADCFEILCTILLNHQMSKNKFSCDTYFLIYNVLPLQELRLSEVATGVEVVAFLCIRPSELSVPFFFLYIVVSHEIYT
jgi:hypothetical protein